LGIFELRIGFDFLGEFQTGHFQDDFVEKDYFGPFSPGLMECILAVVSHIKINRYSCKADITCVIYGASKAI
jgi:hypothetical protein